jgi:hypothetical protein
LPYDLAIPLLGIYLKECDSNYDKRISTPMFIAALFTIPKPINGLRKCSIYTQGNFIEPQKAMKFCHLQVNGWNWRT